MLISIIISPIELCHFSRSFSHRTITWKGAKSRQAGVNNLSMAMSDGEHDCRIERWTIKKRKKDLRFLFRFFFVELASIPAMSYYNRGVRRCAITRGVLFNPVCTNARRSRTHGNICRAAPATGVARVGQSDFPPFPQTHRPVSRTRGGERGERRRDEDGENVTRVASKNEKGKSLKDNVRECF